MVLFFIKFNWCMICKCHKVNFRRCGSCIDSREIKRNPERVSNIKPFINKYNWEGINYPSKIDYSNTFKKTNPTIALNILYTKNKEILLA